jgi:hypothetical protein
MGVDYGRSVPRQTSILLQARGSPLKNRDANELIRLLTLATLQTRFWLFFFHFRDAFEIQSRMRDHAIRDTPEMPQGGKTSPKKLYFGAP